MITKLQLQMQEMLQQSLVLELMKHLLKQLILFVLVCPYFQYLPSILIKKMFNLKKNTRVESREANVISKLPFKPSNAGTKINVSGTSVNNLLKKKKKSKILN